MNSALEFEKWSNHKIKHRGLKLVLILVLYGILLAATYHLLLVGVYIGREIDEKMMKVLNITKRLTKAPQEYQKFITDIRSSQEKFTLKMPSIRVTVVNQVVFLSLSNQAKSEEERKMLLEKYFEEVDDSVDNPQ